MNLSKFSTQLPKSVGKYAKMNPKLKYPITVDIVDVDGKLMEYNSGKFWELRPGESKWATVTEDSNELPA